MPSGGELAAGRAAVEAYIAQAPDLARPKLEELRSIIRGAAPEAEECISYSMPAFRQGKVLVYYAGWTGHVGFYPTASGIESFEKELARWEHSKGAVRFPLDEPLPSELIRRIVAFRLAECAAQKAAPKAAQKAAPTSARKAAK